MTHLKLSFLFSTALACTIVACGSDDSGNDSGDEDSASNGSNGTNSGSGGTDGTGSGGTGNGSGGTDSSGGGTDSGNGNNGTNGNTTGGGGSNACNPGTGGGGGSEECADLSECVQRECADEYEECMGPNFASGNFSGGVCEDYAECANACQSGDDCDAGCVLECVGNISNACQSCLIAAGECGSESCPDEYEACEGSEPTTGTTGNTTGGGDGSCEDLEACCNSLESDAKDSCLATLDAIQQGGDQACAILLASYESAGEC